MGELQHRTGRDLSFHAARRGDSVFTCRRLTRWRQTTVAHKLPTIAAGFLLESVLNLLAAMAVDVSRQPCSDPCRHHVPLWHHEKCRAASKSSFVGLSGKRILATSLSGSDPADARQPRDLEVRDVGVTRLNGRGNYASPDFGSLEPASTTRTRAIGGCAQAGWPVTKIARLSKRSESRIFFNSIPTAKAQ